MIRGTVADHILFDECIRVFRPEQNQLDRRLAAYNGKDNYSFLLTPFKFSIPLNFKEFQVSPSEQFSLSATHCAFINKVSNPEHVENRYANLFGIALAAIASFTWLTPCKSTRNKTVGRYKLQSECDLRDLALNHAVLIAGPGYHPSVSEAKQKEMRSELEYLKSLLLSVDFKTYRIAMQSIRLVHLSVLTKRDDFGLAYQLLVSAIEAVAQHEIKRDQVKEKPPAETEWKRRAKEDTMFKELYDSYKNLRGGQHYLSKRFVLFIEKFAPVENWVSYIPYKYQEHLDLLEKQDCIIGVECLKEQNNADIYPEDLTSEQVKTILSKTYDHRSCYVHCGQQPPHQEPTNSSRFFQNYRSYDDGLRETETLLPNYEFLARLAKNAIINWLSSK